MTTINYMSQYTSRRVPDFLEAGSAVRSFANTVGSYAARRTARAVAGAIASGVGGYVANKVMTKKPVIGPAPLALRKTRYAGKKARVGARKSLKAKTSIRKLSKQVQNLSKEMKSQRSELIYHLRSTGRALSSVNQCTHYTPNANSINNYEAVLAQLRFFDSATPGTLVQADGSSGTYNRDYHFKSVYAAVTAYNNYQVPAKVTIYAVCSKDDTSIASITAYTNGLADVGNPSSTSPMVHLTDSPQFNELWKICSTKTKVLMPGQSLTSSYSVKDVFYNPSVTDSQTNTYQRKYKTFEFIVRVEGVYGHDTTNNEQGQLAAGVDVIYHAKYVVHYDAGGDLKYIYISDSASTFTNGGLVSSKPVADNIGYSVS